LIEIGIEKYLGSGLIKGIGPVFAKKIVDAFGVETLHIIDTKPERLKEIAGVGPKKVSLIANCWNEQRAVRDVMVFLQGHGISPAFAQRIYKRYAAKSIEIITENPYRLAKDLFGVGFLGADKIAASLGIEKESPNRIAAGIEYVLSQLALNGHACYPIDTFIEKTETMLKVNKELIAKEIDILAMGEQVMKEVGFIWHASLYHSERGIAYRLQEIKKADCSLRPVDIEKSP